MRVIYIVLVALWMYGPIIGQDNGCDDQRYLEEVFEDVTITTDIQYGQNTTLGGRSRNLLMDIYEPQGDVLEERPVIIMAHGGSFIAGSKNEFIRMGTDLAKRGFVVASINYRLIDAFVADSIRMTEAVLMALSDMKAAIRFIRETADKGNPYGVNVDLVFAGGTSAGGVMASHIGLLDVDDILPEFMEELREKHGGFEGNSSDNFEYSSSVSGVLNYSGALARVHWLDQDDPPVYSVHDELDEIVPCAYGRTRAVWFPAYLYGSCIMHQRADEVGAEHIFRLYPGSDGHVSYMANNEYPTIVQESSQFLHDIICERVSSSEDISIPEINISPNPVSSHALVSVLEGGQLSIFDFSGQSVWDRKVEGDIWINLSEWPAGAYWVQLTTFTGQTVTTKMIK